MKLTPVRLAAALLTLLAPALRASTPATSGPPVTVTETGPFFALDNGVVTALVAKDSGDLVSFKFKGQEMFATFLTAEGQPDMERDPSGENLNGLNRGMTDHQYGFWSHDAMGVRGTAPAVATVTIDPKANGGTRAEVSVKGLANGRKMGTGPGANTAQSGEGNFAADVEIRYALERGAAGVYTYCTFDHPASYPATTITEARFGMKLADMFDWMLVDATAHRNKLYPKESRENKYSYTVDQFDNRAYGWASSTKNFGCFLIHPSMEYMSGGPTKVEFLCHRDTNAIAAPTVLNYWRSSHYGGAGVSVAAGEEWSKVIGPFLIYANTGPDPQALRQDAIALQQQEEARWPYDWVAGVDYPHHDGRSNVTGQLVLNDPLMPGAKMSHVLVGLAFPDAPGGPGGPGGRAGVSWQTDAKHYEFWARGSDDGRFTIPDVRPGTYQMHAIADGVLGEFTQASVTVEAGKPLDFGKINWAPVRYGRQLWDIGVANRSPEEFYKGDDWWNPTIQTFYATAFPSDVNYVIGKSDYTRDWFYMQIPHASDAAIAAAAARASAPPRGALPGETPPGRGGPSAGAAPGLMPGVPTQSGGATVAGGVRGGAPGAIPGGRGGPGGFGGGAAVQGRESAWKVSWDMPLPGKGTAVLRVALIRTNAGAIPVSLNGEAVGSVGPLQRDGGLDSTGLGVRGIWHEYALPIDASKLKSGTNTLTLTIPAGPLGAGVDYDYVRFELNEDQPFGATP